MTSISAGWNQEVEFRGYALDYLVELAIFWVLMTITGGLYAPWGIMRLSRWYNRNWSIRGTPLEFDASGWDYAVQVLWNWLLRVVTLGLYSPWGACRMQRWVDSHGRWNGQRFQFTGSGFALLLYWLWWAPIMVLTLGLAFPFARVSMQRWFSHNTRVGSHRMAFHGTGTDYAVLLLTHYLLCLVTLGLYFPFGAMREERWFARNMKLQPATDAASVASPTLRPLLGLATTCGLVALVVTQGVVLPAPVASRLDQAVAMGRGALPRLVPSETAPPAAAEPVPEAAPPRPDDVLPATGGSEAPRVEGEVPPRPATPRIWKDRQGAIHITNTP